jgi:hypothetical protein
MPGLIELFPIQNTIETIPSWYKTIPVTVKSAPGPMKGTMRTCPGVSDLYRRGIVIPAWTDMYVDWEKPGGSGLNVQPAYLGEPHDSGQWGDHSVLKDYMHLKFLSPWKFKEKTGVEFLFTNTFWHQPTLKYFVPNGIVEFKDQHTTNVNVWIPKSGFPKTFTIQAGDPVAQLVPLSEKEVVIHTHEIDEKEYMKTLMGYSFTFNAQYFKKKKIKDSKPKKCPLF